MTKKNILGIAKSSLTLLLICLVVTAALAVTNKYTNGPIDEINKKTEQETMEQILKAEKYETVKTTLDNIDYNVNIAKDGEEVKGYIFSVKEKGYGGDISVMTGIDRQGTIIAVKVIDASNETPGLGQNVLRENFNNQYSGKTETVDVVKSEAKDNEITAVTGATISSKAVTRAVNKSREIFEKINADGGVK